MSKENYAKVKEVLKAYNESQKASNGRKLWKKKLLKKKRIKTIEDAFDIVTCCAMQYDSDDIDVAVTLLDKYRLISDYSLHYQYATLTVTLMLTDLGKQVASILYDGGLPPINGGSSDEGDEFTSFKEYEEGYVVTTYGRDPEPETEAVDE